MTSRSNSLGGPMRSPMTSPSPSPANFANATVPPPHPGGLFQPYHHATAQPSPSYRPLRVVRRCAAPSPIPMGVPILPRRSVVASPAPRPSLPIVPRGFSPAPLPHMRGFSPAPLPHMRTLSKQMSAGHMVLSPRYVPSASYRRNPLSSTVSSFTSHRSATPKRQSAPVRDAKRQFVRAKPALSSQTGTLKTSSVPKPSPDSWNVNSLLTPPLPAPFPTVSETSSRGLHSSDASGGGSSGGDRTCSSWATTERSGDSAPGAMEKRESSSSGCCRGSCNRDGLASSFGFNLREGDSDVSISKLDLVKAISDSNERYADIVGTWCATMKGDLPSAAQASLFTLHSTLTTSASSAKKLVDALEKAFMRAEIAPGNPGTEASSKQRRLEFRLTDDLVSKGSGSGGGRSMEWFDTKQFHLRDYSKSM
jgi:hypothetical protein